METLPQRWAFQNVDLIFDIDEKEGSGDDELEVNFVNPPTKADVYFMRKELKRLSFVLRKYFSNRVPQIYTLCYKHLVYIFDYLIIFLFFLIKLAFGPCEMVIA